MYFKHIFAVLFFACITPTVWSQWVNTYTGQGDFSDKYLAVAKDAAGNYYACGSTYNASRGSDILVVKMNSLGDTIWTNIYDGPGNGADEATAIAVDASENVYITGSQRGDGSGKDMVTIKYNNLGEISWINPYKSGSDETDKGISIALDASGNVFVSGQSDSDSTTTVNDDYITIKYDNSGVQQWLAVKNGFGDGVDRPSKLALDPSGNVYVTGRSENGNDDDYLTVKYNGSTGSEMWQKTLDRADNDRATDLVINPADGNIYVTGRSKNLNFDFGTVAYDANGTQLWLKIYDYVDDDRAAKIALDASGNVYVTGNSYSTALEYDFTTIQYSAAGVQNWATTYSGIDNKDDIPIGLQVDAAGNVYVVANIDAGTGAVVVNNVTLIKYDNSGVQTGSTVFTTNSSSNDVATALILDNNDNPVLVGYAETIPERDAFIYKFDSALIDWFKNYKGSGDQFSKAQAIAVDATGNSYVAGYTVAFDTDRNFALQKIDANGVTSWIKTINGTSTASADEAMDVAIDPTGNIFVGGFVKNSNASNDFIVAKYSPLGDSLWAKVYNNTSANESDKGAALAVDASGNVYLAGKSDVNATTGSNDDALLLRYSSTGTLGWIKKYAGTGLGSDAFKAIQIAPSGNVYVAGKAHNGITSDYLLVKYDNTGTQQWVALFDGSGEDEAVAMVIDNAENIYLTGTSQTGIGSDTNMLTVKYDANGTQQWVKSFNGTASGLDEGKDIAIDNTGNLLVTGTTDNDNLSSTINNDMVSIKYDPNGVELWSKTYNNPASGNDEAVAITVDSDNNVIVTGMSDEGLAGVANNNISTIKYMSDGTLDSIYVYDAAGNQDAPLQLAVKGTQIFVTGESYDNKNLKMMLTLSYNGPGAALQELTKNTHKLKVYPNPLINSSTIDYSQMQLAPGSPILVRISDVSGRIVKQLSGKAGEILKINRDELKAGLYSISLESEYSEMQVINLIINE